jgi:hypothetical protein
VGGLALGAQETHPGERVGWQLARIAPLGDVPRAPSSFHCVIDGSPALSLDHVSTGIGLFDHQQFFVKDIDYGAGNGVESRLAEPSAIFQEIPSNEPKTYFMVTFCPNIESREPTIGPVLGENPIKRSSTHDTRCRRRVRFSAAPPRV